MEKKLELPGELFSCIINLNRKLIFYARHGKFEFRCNEKNMPLSMPGMTSDSTVSINQPKPTKAFLSKAWDSIELQ